MHCSLNLNHSGASGGIVLRSKCAVQILKPWPQQSSQINEANVRQRGWVVVI